MSAAKLLRELLLLKRQDGTDMGGLYDDNGDDPYDNDNDAGQSWWWTPTGLAVRYTIVVVLFAVILLYCVGGYWHARRRLRNGQPLLGYHRWMVSRRPASTYALQQQYYHPSAAAPGGYYYYAADGSQHPLPPHGEGYPMYGHYRPPPPAYNGADAPPPVYQPPEGASKVLADQSYHAPPASGIGGSGSGSQVQAQDQAQSQGSSLLAPEAVASASSNSANHR